METLTLNQVSGLLGDLVGSITNGNNSARTLWQNVPENYGLFQLFFPFPPPSQ
jgi:hypothetical protein